MTERLLNIKDTPIEYKNMRMAADIMTAMSEDDCYYVLNDCYLDFGANWMWTTIIKVDPNRSGVLSSCQAINSKQWKEIVAATSKVELLEVMKSVIKN